MVRAALAAVVAGRLVPLAAAVTGPASAGLVVLLVLAPLAPVAAVALAYRDWADPAGEISLATPSAGLRLVALRALLCPLAALPLAFVVLLAVDALGRRRATAAGRRLVPARTGAGRAGPARRARPGSTRCRVAVGAQRRLGRVRAGRGDRAAAACGPSSSST